MYEKQSIELANGETYRYIQKDGGKHAILLIHGNMSSSVHYKPLLDRLPAEFTLYAPDLRGFGDSTYHTPIETLEDLADDLYLFMQAKGISKASLVGWSTGGGIALEFAAKYPSLTHKLVLIESTSHKGYPIFKKNTDGSPLVGQPYASKNEMAQDPVQVLPALNAFTNQDAAFMSWLWDVAIYTHGKPTADDNALYIEETLKQRNLVDIDWALAVINMSKDASAYSAGKGTIGRVQSPVLHIWSKKDAVVPEYMLNENFEALQKLSTKIIYEDSGHSPLIDCPDRLAEDIVWFLGN
jgi:2-hydroxy-6-oxonona-2,4-dienedioate hydrolase